MDRSRGRRIVEEGPLPRHRGSGEVPQGKRRKGLAKSSREGGPPGLRASVNLGSVTCLGK